MELVLLNKGSTLIKSETSSLVGKLMLLKETFSIGCARDADDEAANFQH